MILNGVLCAVAIMVNVVNEEACCPWKLLRDAMYTTATITQLDKGCFVMRASAVATHQTWCAG